MKHYQIPLSKKEFVDAIMKLRDAKELVDKVNELFMYSRESIECDFCNAAALQISHESLVVSLLEKLMNDQSEMISYFIYELDFGAEYENGMIVDEHGNEIVFSSAEAVYNYLIKNYEQ